MRFIKLLLSIIIVGFLVGGGYWAQMNGWNISNLSMLFGGQTQHQMNDQAGHSGHGGNSQQQPLSPFNNFASQNKDKLLQVSTVLNQVMEQITNDPYSQITISRRLDSGDGNSNISVNSREGVTINITGEKEKERQFPPGTTIVYDQAKLEQVHSGIYKFSQAVAILNELNNDLTDQSILIESNPPDLQTYVMRYNLLQQNRNKLNQVTKLLNESMALVNINPYAPESGYAYNSQKMKELHQSIADLGRVSLQLNGINEEMNKQMIQATYDARMARNQAMNPQMQPGMNQNVNHSAHGTQSSSELLNSNSWAVNLGLIAGIMVIVLLVLRLIKKMICEIFVSQK